jgi:hypothetical protein
LERAATRVLKSGLPVAMAAMVGFGAGVVGTAGEGEPVPTGVLDGAVGDMESLQPTTATESTTADRNPMVFFMTLSLFFVERFYGCFCAN